MDEVYTDQFNSVADLVKDEGDAYTITRINVKPEHRRRGLGTALLLRIIRDADELGATLYVVPSGSDPAFRDRALIEWYKRYGFNWEHPHYMTRRPK